MLGADEDLVKLSEVLYIPVFDTLRPAKGTVSVLEVFLSAKTEQSMLCADFISFVSNSMTAVSLSLSNPQPQPVRKSALCGRRARVPDSAQDVREHHQQGGSSDKTPQPMHSPSPPPMIPPMQQRVQQQGDAAHTQGMEPELAGPTAETASCSRPAPTCGGAAVGTRGVRQANIPIDQHGGGGPEAAGYDSRNSGAIQGQHPHCGAGGSGDPGFGLDNDAAAPQRKVRKTSTMMRSKSMHSVLEAALPDPEDLVTAGLPKAPRTTLNMQLDLPGDLVRAELVRACRPSAQGQAGL